MPVGTQGKRWIASTETKRRRQFNCKLIYPVYMHLCFIILLTQLGIKRGYNE